MEENNKKKSIYSFLNTCKYKSSLTIIRSPIIIIINYVFSDNNKSSISKISPVTIYIPYLKKIEEK